MSDPAYREKYRKYQREHYNPQKAKEYREKWLKDSPDGRRASTYKWRKANRVKARAQRMAHRLVPLKEACEICGSKENLMRHHSDYTKPLDVQTLCKTCHEKQPPIKNPEEVKDEERYFNGNQRALILVRGNVEGCSDKRFWRIKLLDTGEELNVYPARLSVLPYPHGFRKDRRPKDWSPSSLDDKFTRKADA